MTISDSEVRAILDRMLNAPSLRVRQMACTRHGIKTTLVRMEHPPYATIVHGCRCDVSAMLGRARAEDKWEDYP